MAELHLPWLEGSILLPLIGAMVVWRMSDPKSARWVSLIVCSLTLLLALGEWIDFATLQTFEAHDHWDLTPWLLGPGALVIDELNAPLIPLAALLCLLISMSTLRTKAHRFAFHWMLISESLLLATLSSRQSWLLIALLIASLIPVWVEIRARGYCTRVFTLHMGLFAIGLVAGQLLIDWGSPLIGGALVTSAALLRSGIIPLHCWMTDLLEKATFGTSIVFLTPMTGAYVVMRLVLPLAPDWALQSIAIVSLITAVYAAGMSLVQREARRFFCYLFLSQASLVLVGLELVTPIGLAGALCVWLSVGLSLGGFGLTLRCLEARVGRISLDQFHGLYEDMPGLAALFLLTGLASIGFPGTVGFVGIELLVEGAVEVYPGVGLTIVLAAALNGIAILLAYFRIFTGRRGSTSFSLAARPAERVAILILTVLIFGGGLYPQWGVASRYHAATELIRIRNQSASGTGEVQAAGRDSLGSAPLIELTARTTPPSIED